MYKNIDEHVQMDALKHISNRIIFVLYNDFNANKIQRNTSDPWDNPGFIVSRVFLNISK